jgi:basic membrane lipoprotein Med (substrate-binding protein (PBP1-ABC) superfamily)/DNA-binding SARP family transcriptional activator
VEFRVLGPLEVIDDGHPLELGPHKQRALLALLLLRPNRVVTTERILEDLWGDGAADKERALWVHVSRLRSALEPGRVQRGESKLLRTRDRGYVLEVDEGSIDALVFEDRARLGRSKLRDDPEAASAILREGLALWRGSAFQDFADDDFAHADTMRLEELRLAALEDRIDADLRCDEARALVGELEQLREQHPLRERPVGQLMLALYRSGRQAEALRAFARFRRHLDDELGTTPSPELCRLEERILLHDLPAATSAGPAVTARRASPPTDAVVNPYKGLHAFRETDADDFFGRDRLVTEVLARLAAGQRLIALVGPSGSGKSSAVRGGVVPALRRGAVPGSQGWLVVQMLPGSHPFAELEAALLREAVDGPDRWSAETWDDDDGLLRAALRVLPDDGTPLLLVVDQFEELFTATASGDVRQRFLDNLLTALDDRRGRVRVLVTLRADAYHLPLEHPTFGSRLGGAVVNVVPLLPDELEAAALGPAARVGVTLEGALLAELLTDVVGQPSALPIFQYALTELFDRRSDDVMTAASYAAMGGVRGALRQRAEDAFAELDPVERDVAEQLFLRLVTITKHEHWIRRRIFASEILAMDVDVGALHAVIERFGAHRFLAFDRDPVSGAPTLEVAHEALLREWDRLRGWIEAARADLRRHGSLVLAMGEWEESGEDPGYLPAGSRLADYQRWHAASRVRLTATEARFLATSAEHDDAREQRANSQLVQAATVRRRARRTIWGLGAAVAVLAVVTVPPLVASDRAPPTVVLAHFDEGNLTGLSTAGLEQAQRRHDLEAIDLAPPFGDLEADLRAAVDDGADLVIAFGPDFAGPAAAVAVDHPEVTWVMLEPGPLRSDRAVIVTFAEEEGSYLAGAAAALTSTTGTVGFVGGSQYPQIETFRAGYEAGAHAVDPEIRVVATYVSASGDGFTRDDLAATAATELFEAGADVVYHAAGRAGLGVIEAARTATRASGAPRWAIGVDSDQYFEIGPELRPFVLASMVKRYDQVVVRLIDDFAAGRLRPGSSVLTLADGAMTLSASGGFLAANDLATIDDLRSGIVAGDVDVPTIPVGELRPPPGVGPVQTVSVDFDGDVCRYDGPATVRRGEMLRIDVRSTASHDADIVFEEEAFVSGTAVPVRAGGRATGYITVADDLRVLCFPDPSSPDGAVLGATIDAIA